MRNYDIIQKLYNSNIDLGDYKIYESFNVFKKYNVYYKFEEVFYTSPQYDILIFNDVLATNFINMKEYQFYLRKEKIQKLLHE